MFHLSPVEDYVLPEEQLRPIDVICIGAGMAGMTASIVAQWRLKRVNLKVVEKNATFSGTWAENRYPWEKSKRGRTEADSWTPPSPPIWVRIGVAR